MTVSLETLKPTDGAWLDTWLPQVADAVGYEQADASSLLQRMKAEQGFQARAITREGANVGVVLYDTQPNDIALIELIATPPEHARKGAGMAAAALAEDEMRRAGVRTVFAPAPAANGVSMYFWIRLGYAPILRVEWPCERDGVAWLRRAVATP